MLRKRGKQDKAHERLNQGDKSSTLFLVNRATKWMCGMEKTKTKDCSMEKKKTGDDRQTHGKERLYPALPCSSGSEVIAWCLELEAVPLRPAAAVANSALQNAADEYCQLTKPNHQLRDSLASRPHAAPRLDASAIAESTKDRQRL